MPSLLPPLLQWPSRLRPELAAYAAIALLLAAFATPVASAASAFPELAALPRTIAHSVTSALTPPDHAANSTSLGNDYLATLGPAPLRFVGGPKPTEKIAMLPPLPPPPAPEISIPIQPPPALVATRVDTANPPPVPAPVTLAEMPSGPPAPRVDPAANESVIAQSLLQFFTNRGTNGSPRTVVVPVGFTPPVNAPAPSSRAVFERTP